ncbi:hypothetical protein H072_5953 [Dactylellina haptotyla CBS 200.50]|uniref:Protein SYS1 n=1 Tax=Dactylellina haptotyla (strain CBS 200.50) TaxID=1284197 RepID=S8AGF8_DACHA|nr:hypothetical protein H072_5953 [Dactylellina haptotyla CBS 200.50]
MPRRRRVRPASALESLPPLWILSQILILQTAFYAVAAVLFLFTSLVLGSSFSLNLVFSWVPLQADNAAGWTLAMVWICNCLTNVTSITLLVGRAKYVLDFSLTIHLIHFLITSFYSRSIPRSWLWWAVLFGSSVITITAATWACQKRELQPLTIGVGGRGRSTNNLEAGQDHEMQPLKSGRQLP